MSGCKQKTEGAELGVGSADGSKVSKRSGVKSEMGVGGAEAEMGCGVGRKHGA